MKISFMTLGCPKWDLDTICTRGQAYGFDGIDFRGYLDELDITRLLEFTTHAAPTRRKLADAGLEVSAISSSIRICVQEELDKSLDEARRTIAAAQGLGCQNVRIFGGGDLNKHSRQELVKIGQDTIGQLLALEGARSLHWLFETHDLWVQAENCRLLLEAIPDPSFGVLWDMGHTWRAGGETPQASYDAIGPRVGYTHVKDAVYEPASPLAMQDGWYYVSPGSGQLPLAESIALLRQGGYDGWLTCEHEKRWHPELPEPEELFPAFVRWIKARMKAEGGGMKEEVGE